MSIPILPTDTPAEQVFHKHHLIDNIYSWGLSRADLKSCMVLCRKGMGAAARGLYKGVPEDLPNRLLGYGCSWVSEDCKRSGARDGAYRRVWGDLVGPSFRLYAICRVSADRNHLAG